MKFVVGQQTEVDMHKCQTVDKSEDTSDGDTETEGRVTRAASHHVFTSAI